MLPTLERDAHLDIHDNFSFVICIHVLVILVISHFKSLNTSLLQLPRKLMELMKVFLKARMLAFLVLHGGRNQRT